MGKLVRRSVKTDVLLVGRNIQLGTWDSPKALGIASVKAVQAVHSVFIAGTSEGGLFGVKGSITSGNLNIYGVHARATILTGKNLGTGLVRGVYIEVEALGTAITTGLFEGLDIETYVESGASIGDHYGIYVKTYSDIAGNREVYPLRLEHNGASIANAFIGVFNQTGKMRYLLVSSATAETWCGVTGTPSTIAGWLKVKLGGYDRWIALYSGAP